MNYACAESELCSVVEVLPSLLLADIRRSRIRDTACKLWSCILILRPTMAFVKAVIVAIVMPTVFAEAAAEASDLTNLTVSLRGSVASSTCTASWGSNCMQQSRCCETGFTCFEKTPRWAACLKTCQPGIVQPGDNGKQIPWTCKVLGGSDSDGGSDGSQGGGGQPGTSRPPNPAPMPACKDLNQYCSYWQSQGECEKNPAYMNQNCPTSCNACPGMNQQPGSNDQSLSHQQPEDLEPSGGGQRQSGNAQRPGGDPQPVGNQQLRNNQQPGSNNQAGDYLRPGGSQQPSLQYCNGYLTISGEGGPQPFEAGDCFFSHHLICTKRSGQSLSPIIHCDISSCSCNRQH